MDAKDKVERKRKESFCGAPNPVLSGGILKTKHSFDACQACSVVCPSRAPRRAIAARGFGQIKSDVDDAADSATTGRRHGAYDYMIDTSMAKLDVLPRWNMPSQRAHKSLQADHFRALDPAARRRLRASSTHRDQGLPPR
jgi:hypothetical protein